MTEIVQRLPIRERLKDLNTKAYYLLVALSFIYRTSSATFPLKLAFTLTAAVAAFPMQDFVCSSRVLEGIRWFKVLSLGAAVVCALIWIWTVSATTN